MPSAEDVHMDEGTTSDGGSRDSSGFPKKEVLEKLILDAQNAELVDGDTWFLVCQSWWTTLCKSIRDGFIDDVGSIDNTKISESRHGQFYLKPRLAESVDYIPVPERVFKKLERYYSVEDDRRDYIRRTVVRKPDGLCIEIYPRIVHVSLARNRELKVDLQLKPDDTMESLRNRVIEELSLSATDNIRFYVMNGDTPELIDTTQSVDSYFDTVQKVLVDVEKEGEFFIKAKIPAQNKSLFGSNSSPRIAGNGHFNSPPHTNTTSLALQNSQAVTGSAHRSPPGQCGLNNLGNTCFMASALQCISNMPPLREYFISGAYERDLNEDNPLGTQGNLAVAVGELLRGMWSGEYSSINPRRFKGIIGQFAPRFNGYSQQDAHELMAYVLDGLHEDLNRIKKKPYIEDNDEMAKLPEAEHAEKSWEVYKMRNDSIIVDTLHGQLKSTLICPVCEKISIKFDPFGYLSLPLPPKEQIVKQTVLIMFLNRKWAKFSLGITDTTTVSQAEELMLNKLQLEKKPNFVFFHVPNQYNDEAILMRPTERVRQQGKEVYVAEVEHDVNQPGTRFIIAYNRVKLMRSCSLPMVYSIPAGGVLTRDFLDEHVFARTKQFFFKQNADANANDDDDSMSGNAASDELRGEPYKLFVLASGTPGAAPLPLDPTSDAIPFPDESAAADRYRNVIQVTFQWKEMKMFNQYRGSDLIEREMTVAIRRKVELEETLDWFTTKEQLGEQDSWYCPQCKKHERATKQLDLWKLPEVLILHLKRFQYTKWSREKLTWEVVIPVRGLDLTNKVANPNHERAVYDLIAVSRHYGSLSGGHYTAFAYNDKVQTWLDFNDASSFTRETPADPHESADPYILVYRRRKLDANGQPIETTVSDPVEVSDYVPGGGSTSSSSSPSSSGGAGGPSTSTTKRTASKRSNRHQIDENMEMEED